MLRTHTQTRTHFKSIEHITFVAQIILSIKGDRMKLLVFLMIYSFVCLFIFDVQVPFGYIPAVRDWMQLRGHVAKPEQEIAARPVTGLLCDKSEQSGQRFWGLMQEVCGEAEHFFNNCFVHNLCPLAFFHASGRNITPAELKV